MKELWKAVVGHEGFYEVSDMGRVRSLDRAHEVIDKNRGLYTRTRKGVILIPGTVSGGYLQVSLSSHGKKRNLLIHRLVLVAFSTTPATDQETRHMNGVRSDNKLKNLKWGTRVENQADRRRHGTSNIGEQGPGAKLTNAAVRVIRKLNGRMSQKEIAAVWQVNRRTVGRVLLNKCWTHV